MSKNKRNKGLSSVNQTLPHNQPTLAPTTNPPTESKIRPDGQAQENNIPIHPENSGSSNAAKTESHSQPGNYMGFSDNNGATIYAPRPFWTLRTFLDAEYSVVLAYGFYVAAQSLKLAISQLRVLKELYPNDNGAFLGNL